MKKIYCQINSRAGLHARPALMLVRCVKSLESTVYLCVNDKKIHVNDPVKIMTLRILYGTIVMFEVNGVNEIQDTEILKTFCNNNL